MVFIYILKLQSGKYYVGKTNDPSRRIEDHNVKGSEWTKKYKPVRLIELLSNCDNFDEDKYTLKYMARHGIDNVRGGTFCKITIPSMHTEVIREMIIGATDRCPNYPSIQSDKKEYRE